MTSLTPLKSTPLPITSVQIKHQILPSANPLTTSSRSSGVRSAWMQSALTPSKRSSVASSFARRIDWTKMRTGGVNEPSVMRVRSERSLWSSVPTNWRDWAMVSVAASLRDKVSRCEKIGRETERTCGQ